MIVDQEPTTDRQVPVWIANVELVDVLVEFLESSVTLYEQSKAFEWAGQGGRVVYIGFYIGS